MKKALVISGISWNSVYQRHQLNSNLLASYGFNVDFLEACKTSEVTAVKLFALLSRFVSNQFSRGSRKSYVNNKSNSVNIISSRFLPPGGMSTFINNFIFKFQLKKHLSKKYDLILIYVPSDHLKFIDFEDSLVVYDCVRAFRVWGGYHKKLYLNEEFLANNADVVICDSFYIKNEYFKGFTETVKPIQLLPPIEVSFSPSHHTGQIKNIGYFGSISEHIDIDIFSTLLDNGYIVHFWGQDSDSLLPEGVIQHGYIEEQNELLDSIVRHCDSLVIPYKNIADGVYPAKLGISLASRLPVFCSSFYDSNFLIKLLYVYSNVHELLELIDRFNVESYTEKQKFVDAFLDDNKFVEYDQKFRGICGANKST